jgi:YHS domain-containing protein
VRKEIDMTERRTVASNEDPVCGMTVDVGQARAKGLASAYEGREYAFCGKGCFLEFRDDPEAFLAPDFTPTM